jgi:hypothetical protein
MGKKISLLVAFGNFLLNDRASKESHPEKQDVVSDSDIQNFLNSQKEAKKNRRSQRLNLMQSTIPTPEEVKEHFLKAKEIRCLNLNTVFNINHVTKFDYNESSNSYSCRSGLVVVWKDNEYAPIVKKKCEKCKNCNCK